MTRRESYLDWNATAPLRPEAAAAVAAALEHCGNPSSVHRWGRAARQMVEQAREAVAALVGANPAGVVFVSGGTEANHLALLGSDRERILVSAIEHNSVLQAVPSAERIAVDHYRELIRYFGNNDPATRTMLESILSKEEEHANDMLDLLAAHGK